jgi:hypothetical protein
MVGEGGSRPAVSQRTGARRAKGSAAPLLGAGIQKVAARFRGRQARFTAWRERTQPESPYFRDAATPAPPYTDK